MRSLVEGDTNILTKISSACIHDTSVVSSVMCVIKVVEFI